MKRKNIIVILIIIGIFTMPSCNRKKLFEQPSIEVTKVTLLELPGDNTYLELDLLVTNNDDREARIADVEYLAVIEGFTAEQETSDIDQDILVGTPLELTLPLTLKTKDAIQLLIKLEKGEELAYEITGTFHVDETFLKRFDLPIDIKGTTSIDIGIDDFYKQPEVTVNTINLSSTDIGLTSYTFQLEVDCSVKNMDDRDATIDEVEYFVIVEGVKSATHWYSDSYVDDINIAAGETISLSLPVTLSMGLIEGVAFVAALADGTADYTIEGMFHTVKVDGAAADFLLPLYETGNVPVTNITTK